MEVILDNYTITISIVIVSFFTAMITSIAGAGGGTILLAYMLQFINPLVAIPIHGTVQLTSNITRAFLFRKYLVWKLILPFCIFLPLGVFVGLIIFKNLDAQKIKFLIGVFIILTLKDSLHENPWQMNILSTQFANRHQLIDFNDCAASSHRQSSSG